MTTTINPTQARTQLNQGGQLLIDVRTPAEFASEHISGALNLPLADIDEAKVNGLLESQNHQGDILVMCLSGKRAGMACEKLVGLSDRLKVIEGGIEGLKQAGAETVKSGRNVISLERQVRIAAGALVFTGVVLGALVNPAFYGLAGFVGAGLVFAGITDTCAMGMLIARMPWNKA